MKERFQDDDMAFPNIPKQTGVELIQMVTDQTQRRLSGPPLTGQRAVSSQPAADGEALQILQRRLAAGEITREQCEQLRHVLNGS